MPSKEGRAGCQQGSVVALLSSLGRTLLGVDKGDERRQQASDGRLGQERAVCVERIEADRAFTHVDEALGDANDKEAVGLLLVVASQLAEHLREPGIVGAGADEAHRKNGVHRDLEVIVVRVLGQRVEDAKLRVRCRKEAERERDSLADDGVAVVHLKQGGRAVRQGAVREHVMKRMARNTPGG
jgi:hypothetical protein